MKKITFLIFLLAVSFGFSQNLVTNGDFQTGTADPWYNNAANPVDLGGGNFVNEANVGVAGNPWDVNLSQDIDLQDGITYELSFDAFTDATTGTRTILAGIGQNGPGWANLTQTPVLTATSQTFTYQFTVNYGNAVVDRVLFDMGAAAGFVFIDNVSVTEVVDAAPPTGFTASVGSIGAFGVELLLNATDDSGSVTYDISYNGGAITVQTTGTSGVDKSFTVTGLTPETAYTFEVSASDASGNTATNNPIAGLNATTLADTNTSCAGFSNEASEGSYSVGYNYSFITTGTDVNVTFELLDTDKTGFNPQIFIAPSTFINMNAGAAPVYTGTISGFVNGTMPNFAIRGAYAGGLVTSKVFDYTVGDNCVSTPPGEDATLSDLQVDGATISGFGPGTTSYNYSVPSGTVDIPQITGAVTTQSGATVTSITQASAIPGNATVLVTASNGTDTETYTVSIFAEGPATAAPTPPARLAGDVKSIFSDAYTDINVNTFDTPWCPGVTTEVSISGDAIKKVTGLGCEGVEFTSGRFDASGFTHFHIDIYTDTATLDKSFNMKFSNWLGGAGENNFIEFSTTNVSNPALPNPNPGTWISLDIPLSDWTAGDRTDLVQFIISSNLGTVYYDNLYLHKNSTLSNESFVIDGLKIYPNPTQDTWNINTNNVTMQSIQVFDVLGKNVISLSPNASEAVIEGSSLKSGLYFARIQTASGTSSLKLVKK